jgi:phosphatidylserine synthase
MVSTLVCLFNLCSILKVSPYNIPHQEEVQRDNHTYIPILNNHSPNVMFVIAYKGDEVADTFAYEASLFIIPIAPLMFQH